MPTSAVTCRRCGLRFNYAFTPGVSLTAIRLGSVRIFRCPQCRLSQAFDLRTPGPDPNLPTYADPLGTNLWVLLLVAAVGVFLIALAPVILPRGTAPVVATAFIPAAVLICLLVVAAYGLHRSELQRVPAG